MLLTREWCSLVSWFDCLFVYVAIKLKVSVASSKILEHYLIELCDVGAQPAI